MLDRINRWIRLTKAAREKYDSWPEYTHNEWAENVMQQSRDAFDRVQAKLDAGDVTAAYMESTTGTIYAWMAHEFGRYVYQLPTQGVDSLIVITAAARLARQGDQLHVRRHERFRPRTFDQMARYLIAGLPYFEGFVPYEIAEDFKRLHESKYLQAHADCGRGTRTRPPANSGRRFLDLRRRLPDHRLDRHETGDGLPRTRHAKRGITMPQRRVAGERRRLLSPRGGGEQTIVNES